MKLLIIFLICIQISLPIPLVVNTWNFQNATKEAWRVLSEGEANKKDVSIEALAAGCKTCQDEQCDTTVGYGGSPDENGETALDAMIFDGDTINMGAVGNLRRIKDAINVAKYVLENTEHSLLAGNLATDFAKSFGFLEESLQTNFSLNQWENWKENNCQPNFWKNVEPNPQKSCGPYKPKENRLSNEILKYPSRYNSQNHDTIGMVVISGNGHVVSGTSTNGAKFKIPGRVGDSPIPGAGAYADSKFGAAVATGDGDVMMRFLPSFLAVEKLRDGVSSQKAASIALARITEKYPNFFGAIVVVDKKGTIGAACNGMETFPYTLANAQYPEGIIKYIKCT
ncbi:unnamed protein product [Phyllotreta striolata]|uniref:N(4)-(beta-N-acetylglucosaminyl)-L-asparaginase n=1 Tax=Phyllotreta striolata TaxID=444603 RepID=A0A9N9TIK5_PHYSR|nr:unnamed protein product [Phyllotreta striolata]